MMPSEKGSIRLFRIFGIQVYLDWLWFLLAIWFFQEQQGKYSSPVWIGLELISLFVMVLLHEFGHALACRSVGGQADHIVLWPFGGVAYVSPPPRPGATLWSIAAGPMVNVILLPLLTIATLLVSHNGFLHVESDLGRLIVTIFAMNIMLLLFNLLPIYPLDGGQVLQCVLWFFLGRARSLMVSSIIGIVGVGSVLCLALLKPGLVTRFIQPVWLLLMAFFILMNCWKGFVYARRLAREAVAPPFNGLSCPSCGNPLPPLASATYGNDSGTANYQMITCPYCGKQYVLRP